MPGKAILILLGTFCAGLLATERHHSSTNVCAAGAAEDEETCILQNRRQEEQNGETWPHPKNILFAGQKLWNQGALENANGWRAVMEHDCNFVLYDAAKQKKWASGNAGKGHTQCYAEVSDSGYVWVKEPEEGKVLKACRGGSLFDGGHGHRLVLQDDNKLVLYSQGGQALWDIAMGCPSDTLYLWEKLMPGHTLETGNGWTAVMQNDCNFVIYDGAEQAQWATGDSGKGYTDCYLKVHSVAFFVGFSVYTKDGLELTRCGPPYSDGYRLTLGMDGNLVLYEKSNKPVWEAHDGCGQDPIIQRRKLT